MTFDFSPKKEKKAQAKAEKEKNLTAHEKAYREREKNEQERYKKAVDGDIWICFCFHDDKEKQEFAKIVNARDDDFCFGDDLRKLFTEKIGIQNKRVFAISQIVGEKVKNPLKEVEQTASLEADCFAEAKAILQAFESRKKKDYYENVFDSAFCITAVFEGSQDVSDFIADFRLANFGGRYMNGSKVLNLIK